MSKTFFFVLVSVKNHFIVLSALHELKLQGNKILENNTIGLCKVLCIEANTSYFFLAFDVGQNTKIIN